MTSIYNPAGAEVLNVNALERIITVIVVPYEQETLIEWGGEVWTEVFAAGSFDPNLHDLTKRRIAVNRNHNEGDLVGRVTRLDTRDRRGLIADLLIAKTERGDDTLGLAMGDDMLSCSIGFASFGRSGTQVDTYRKVRRVTSAYCDHVALTAKPAYPGARVLAVRHGNGVTPDPTLDPGFWKVLMWSEDRTWQQQRSRR